MGPSLGLIWLIAVVIAAIVALLLTGMLVLRLWRPLREMNRDARRRQLVALLTQPTLAARDEARIGKAPRALVADVCIELLQMVRGEEKARIVEAGRRAGVVDTLHARLRSLSPGVRLAAAEALGDFVDDEVAGWLDTALDDATSPVRLAAAIALAGADRAPPLRRLVDRLELGSADSSRLIIRLFADRAAAHPEEVAALLTDAAVPDLAKTYAAEALAAQGNYDAVPAIVDLVRDPETSAVLLPGYLAVLGRLAHPAATPAVEHGLNHDDWQVRAAAAEAAGRVRMTASVARLEALLGDEHWLVRRQAGEALAALGRAGEEALERAAVIAEGPAREAATIELAQRPA